MCSCNRSTDSSQDRGTLYLDLARQGFELNGAKDLVDVCMADDVNGPVVGIAVCALAELGEARMVEKIVSMRIQKALAHRMDGDESFMLSKALIILGDSAIKYNDSLVSGPDEEIRLWGITNYGFWRDSPQALAKLIELTSLEAGSLELRNVVFYSLSQHASTVATKRILELFPRCSAEQRSTLTRYLMSSTFDEEAIASVQVLYESEPDESIKLGLLQLIKRGG